MINNFSQKQKISIYISIALIIYVYLEYKIYIQEGDFGFFPKLGGNDVRFIFTALFSSIYYFLFSKKYKFPNLILGFIFGIFSIFVVFNFFSGLFQNFEGDPEPILTVFACLFSILLFYSKKIFSLT